MSNYYADDFTTQADKALITILNNADVATLINWISNGAPWSTPEFEPDKLYDRLQRLEMLSDLA